MIIHTQTGSTGSATRIPRLVTLTMPIPEPLRVEIRAATSQMSTFTLAPEPVMVAITDLHFPMEWVGAILTQPGDGIMDGDGVTLIIMADIVPGIIHGTAHAAIAMGTMNTILITHPTPTMAPESHCTEQMEAQEPPMPAVPH